MSTTILRAIRDPKLFKPWFKDPNSWVAWFAFLRALFALPMAEEDLAVYRQCTGRIEPPAAPSTEAWLICGRRAGKSFVLALCAVFLATFHEYRRYLTRGERATVMVIARDRRQTRIILGYVRALLTGIPMLRQMIAHETAEGFDLDNGVTIEVHVASFRGVRGYAIVAALCDELAFWPTDDAADPDYAVIDALRPGMAQFPNAMLLCASSPYARRGALHDAYKRHFGKDGDPVLVWKAPTRVMNPTVSQSVVDAAMGRDASDAAAEWMAEFRADIETFVPIEVVEQCVGDYVERLPLQQHEYHAFCDPSGGSSDSFTLAISHKEGERVVIDCIREVKPPFSPEATINDFTVLLKSYRVDKVTGDKYAGEFPRELFRRRGITYVLCNKPKSDLYRDLLPGLNSGRIVLPRSERLINQLVGLERRTTRAGKDSIDHAPGAHDDIANAVAGAFDVIAARRPIPRLGIGNYGGSFRWVGGGDDDEIDPAEWANAARNVEFGSAPSSIAKGSDVPNDFVLRVTGLAP
jgi:hypothetical protein